MKNVFNQNSLLLWLLLSLSIHVAALAWCPIPGSFNPPYPVYLVVDLFSGPATSETGDGLNADSGGGGKPAASTTPPKEPLQKSPPAVPEPPVTRDLQDLERLLPTKPDPAENTDKQDLAAPEPQNVKTTPEQPPAPAADVKTTTAPAVTVTAKPPASGQDNLVQGPATPDGRGTGTGSGTGSGPGSDPGREGGAVPGSPVETPMAYGSNPPPPYPRTARRRGWEGEVLLLVSVTAAGDVCKVEVKRSSGHRLLDRTAVNAVYRWRFQAARSNGRAVAGQVMVPIRFSLKDAE